jgi:hypothetical protein
MHMPFTTRSVVGGGTFVEGTDAVGTQGSTILFDHAWSAYQEHVKHSAALDEYDAAVKAFFAPLVEAAEAVKADEKKDWASITVEEPTEGKPGKGIHLGPEGVILRIIAETDGSSLRWVNGQLIALED